MRGMHLGAVIGLLAGVAFLVVGEAQVRSIDAESLLTTRFGFTPAEVAQARGGTAVVKLLPTQDSAEVGVISAVRIDASVDRLVYWLKDIGGFRKTAELGLARRLSDPPQINDFADLSFDSSELDALKKCRPGDCELMMGDKAIQRFQTEVDWTRSDAATQANLLLRQLMLSHAQAYLAGGNKALGAAHNEKTPLVFVDEFQKILKMSTALYDVAAPLARYLDAFPAATLPESEQFLYWAKAVVGPEASITLHQLVIYHAPGGEVFVMDKQLYASRYLEAALYTISTAKSPTGTGFYALIASRARSTMLTGVGARMLRGKVEGAVQTTARDYLGWLRASLTM